MLLPSGWNAHTLTPLPSLQSDTFSADGVIPTDEGQAVAWLGDAPRVEGHVFALATQPADRTIPLPNGGQTLLFDDGSFLLANSAQKVFPAPFRSARGLPSTALLAKMLDHHTGWATEWTGGPRTGHLVPSFLPCTPVLSPQDEADLTELAENLLTILRVPHTKIRWLSQPILRSGQLEPPAVSPWPNAATNPHWDPRVNVALQLLWLGGFPIPNLPGQTLRDGRRERVALDLSVASPPIASAHERIKIEQRTSCQNVRRALARYLSGEGLAL